MKVTQNPRLLWLATLAFGFGYACGDGKTPPTTTNPLAPSTTDTSSSSTNEPSPTTDEMPSVPPAPGLRLDAGRPLSESSSVEATTSAPDSSSDLATKCRDLV